MSVKFKSFVGKPPKRYPWQLGAAKNVIGVVEPCYGSAHVIYGLPRQRYVHREVMTVPLKRFDTNTTYYKFTPLVLDFTVPIVHTWNAIPRNGDFIVSFELELPRFLHNPTDEQIKRGMAMLDSPRCKAILALSDFAFDFASSRFTKTGFPQLIDKMSVFRGAVVDPLKAGERPPRPSFADKPFSAVVIGTDLFRKGGMYAVQAFERLRADGLDVRLTLIGDFGSESYVFRDYLPSADAWRERAKSHSWITFKGAIPNAEVFDELLSHDICLYPSMDESLGWLIIEAGMLGVPILGNRVCAFPELIKHDETGWLVDLPLQENGRWVGIDRDGEFLEKALNDANDRIVLGIQDCVRHILANPARLAQWGVNGREMMTRLYGMEQAGVALEGIYDRILLPN